MGLLDQVTSKLGGESGGGMMDAVLGLINNPQVGGLNGLVQTLKEKGLGEAVQSWISTGQNLPVSGDQIQSALGSEQVKQIAEKIGISPELASGKLAELLPQVIDKLTPDGALPEGGMLEKGIALLKGKLFG